MARPYLVDEPASGTQTATGAFAVTGGILAAQAPTSFTIPTGYNCLMWDTVTIGSGVTVTIEGTGALVVIGG